MREIDRILNTRVTPLARALGFRESGRKYYKENILEDLGLVVFRYLELPTGEIRLRVDFSIELGVFRRLRAGFDAQPLPVEFADGVGEWMWEASAPDGYRREHSTVWDDITMWGAGDALEREAKDVWFPLLDSLIEPGVVLSEMQNSSGKFPGRFSNGSDRIAMAILNSRNAEPDVAAEAFQVLVRRRPEWAEKVAGRLGPQSSRE